MDNLLKYSIFYFIGSMIIISEKIEPDKRIIYSHEVINYLI